MPLKPRMVSEEEEPAVSWPSRAAAAEARKPKPKPSLNATAGIVVKTARPLEGALQKVFINCVQHEAVELPMMNGNVVEESFIDERGLENLRVPLLVGTLRAAREHSGSAALVIDVCFSNVVLTKALKGSSYLPAKYFMTRLAELAIKFAEDDLKFPLSRRFTVLKNTKYKNGEGEPVGKPIPFVLPDDCLPDEPPAKMEQPAAAAAAPPPSSAGITELDSNDDNKKKKSAEGKKGKKGKGSKMSGGFFSGAKKSILYPKGSEEGHTPEGAGDPLGYIPKSLRDKLNVINTGGVSQKQMNSQISDYAQNGGPKPGGINDISKYPKEVQEVLMDKEVQELLKQMNVAPEKAQDTIAKMMRDPDPAKTKRLSVLVDAKIIETQGGETGLFSQKKKPAAKPGELAREKKQEAPPSKDSHEQYKSEFSSMMQMMGGLDDKGGDIASLTGLADLFGTAPPTSAPAASKPKPKPKKQVPAPADDLTQLRDQAQGEAVGAAAHFKGGREAEAVASWRKAIAMIGPLTGEGAGVAAATRDSLLLQQAKWHNNCAMACSRSERHTDAVQAAEAAMAALQRVPAEMAGGTNYVAAQTKAMWRRATAYMGLGQWESAMADLALVLKHTAKGAAHDKAEAQLRAARAALAAVDAEADAELSDSTSIPGSEPSAPTEAPGAREASAGEAEAAVGKSDEVSLATPAHRVSREGNGDVRVCITLPEVSSMKQVLLDVSPTELVVEVPGLYSRLSVPFPGGGIDMDGVRAKFKKSRHELHVTAPPNR